MFVNIGPAEYNMEESVTTLVYGSRSKLIVNNSQKNVETHAPTILNEAYKRMQMQLDLALNELKNHNLPIPNEIQVEPIMEMKLDDIKEEPEEDISKFPEINNDSINLSPEPNLLNNVSPNQP